MSTSPIYVKDHSIRSLFFCAATSLQSYSLAMTLNGKGLHFLIDPCLMSDLMQRTLLLLLQNEQFHLNFARTALRGVTGLLVLHL